jgi:hypothetical protein
MSLGQVIIINRGVKLDKLKEEIEKGKRWTKGYQEAENLFDVKWHYDEIKDFRMDKDFVIIKINKEQGMLELGVVNGTQQVGAEGKKFYEIKGIVRGKKPSDVYWYLAKYNLLTLPEHYAYVGKELQKAYSAMAEGKEYVQE